MNFQFSEDCNIFRAEISVISITVNCLRYHKIYGKGITIVTDSRSITKSLTDLVHKCRTTLNEMALQWGDALQWVRPYALTIELLINGLMEL